MSIELNPEVKPLSQVPSEVKPELKPIVSTKPTKPTKHFNPEAKAFVPEKKPTALDLHPCVNCGKSCKGKQCRECHVKMIQSECADCKTHFNARRKDGTMRKRCLECQEGYNKKYIRKCPDCTTEFHDLSHKYETCLQCYKNRQEAKKVEYEKIKVEREYKNKERSDKWENEKKDCYNRGCKNMTIYKFCKTCNDDRKHLNNNFMTYTCQDCGYRGRGDYTLCMKCA